MRVRQVALLHGGVTSPTRQPAEAGPGNAASRAPRTWSGRRKQVRRAQLKHLNQISIQPFVKNVTLKPPGAVTVIEFTPTRAGTFRIWNPAATIAHEGRLTIGDNIVIIRL